MAAQILNSGTRAIIGIAALFASIPAYSIGVYSFDFDNAVVVAPGVVETLSLGSTARTSIRGVQGYSVDGFVGDMLVSNGISSSATTLTLENLPAHNSISIGFLLATINSWDGQFNLLAPDTTPDLFIVEVDGVVVFSESFRNIPDDPNSQGTFVPPPGALLSIGEERWANNNPVPPIADAAYNMAVVDDFLNIPHTGSTLEIRFYAGGAGWQPIAFLRGDFDEMWGIDELRVAVDDIDGDGLDDAVDNCVNVVNPAQIDVDLDGYGNFCDADFQNDCIVNFADLEIFAAAFFSNEPLIDLNSDGAIGFIDLALLRQMFFGRPGPSGLSSLCDP